MGQSVTVTGAQTQSIQYLEGRGFSGSLVKRVNVYGERDITDASSFVFNRNIDLAKAQEKDPDLRGIFYMAHHHSGGLLDIARCRKDLIVKVHPNGDITDEYNCYLG